MTISSESNIPRVQAIEQQQERSEILISVVQLFVDCVWPALCDIAKTHGGGCICAGSWVLGAYLLFSLLRLTLAIRRQLPDGALYLSAAADITLLLVDLEFPYSIRTTGIVLPEGTDPVVRLYIHRPARIALDPRFVIASGISAL